MLVVIPEYIALGQISKLSSWRKQYIATSKIFVILNEQVSSKVFLKELLGRNSLD